MQLDHAAVYQASRVAGYRAFAILPSAICYLLLTIDRRRLPFTRLSRNGKLLRLLPCSSTEPSSDTGFFFFFIKKKKKKKKWPGVLIGSLEFHHLGASTGGIGSVIYIYPARTVRRSIERYLDLDAAFGSKDLHFLVRYNLGTTGEYGMPGRKIEARPRTGHRYATPDPLRLLRTLSSVLLRK